MTHALKVALVLFGLIPWVGTAGVVVWICKRWRVRISIERRDVETEEKA